MVRSKRVADMLKYILQGLKYRAGTEGERVCLVSEKKKKDHMLEVEDTDTVAKTKHRTYNYQ